MQCGTLHVSRHMHRRGYSVRRLVSSDIDAKCRNPAHLQQDVLTTGVQGHPISSNFEIIFRAGLNSSIPQFLNLYVPEVTFLTRMTVTEM